MQGLVLKYKSEGDMTEEKEDMTTRKISSVLVGIIFLNKEIGVC